MVQTVGVTTTAYAKANKDKLRKLIQARRRAVEFIYANPEETAKIVAKHYGAEEAVILKAVKNLSALRDWGRGEFEYPAMDNMVEGLRIIGEVEGKVDWSKIVDESFLK
jgi:NitT/TauT family transport system substrate-binding protein